MKNCNSLKFLKIGTILWLLSLSSVLHPLGFIGCHLCMGGLTDARSLLGVKNKLFDSVINMIATNTGERFCKKKQFCMFIM